MHMNKQCAHNNMLVWLLGIVSMSFMVLQLNVSCLSMLLLFFVVLLPNSVCLIETRNNFTKEKSGKCQVIINTEREEW